MAQRERVRELLDPDLGEPIALPNDDLLIGDLTAPHWRVAAGGKIQVESKDDIHKRLHRSTDAGDAVVQAFWEESQIIIAAPSGIEQPNHWAMESVASGGSWVP